MNGRFKFFISLVCFLSTASGVLASREEYANEIKDAMKNVMPAGSRGGTLQKAKLVTVSAAGESQTREALAYRPMESKEQLFFKEERRSPLGFSKSQPVSSSAPPANPKTAASVSFAPGVFAVPAEPLPETPRADREKTVKTRHGTEFVFKNNLIVQVTDAKGVVTSFEYVRDESGKIVKKIARRSDGKIQFFYYK